MPPQKKLKKNQFFLPVPIFSSAPVRSTSSVSEKSTEDGILSPLIAFSGGGGAAKSGVKNSIIFAQVVAPSSSQMSLNPVHKIDMGSELVHQIDTSKDGRLLAASTGDSLRLFTVKSSSKDCSTSPAASQITVSKPVIPAGGEATEGCQNVVRISRDSRYLLTGGNDNLVKIWDLKCKEGDSYTLSLKHSSEGHEKEVTDIACHPTEGRFASISPDGTCRLWKEDDSKCLQVILAPKIETSKYKVIGKYIFKRIHFARGGSSLVGIVNPTRGPAFFVMYDVDEAGEKYNQVLLLKVHDVPICTLTVSDDGYYVGLGSPDGITSTWRISKKGEEPSLTRIAKSDTVHELPATAATFLYNETTKGKEPLALLTASADYSTFLLYSKSSKLPWQVVFVLVMIIIALILQREELSGWF